MRHAERRAQTRQRLLDAAADVFARLGFHAATLDDIADAAGYTKGAVYSNFAGKNVLFLALLDRHLDDQLVQVEQLATMKSGTELQTTLRAASSQQMGSGGALRAASSQQMGSGGAFGLLMLEFWLYAARDDDAKAALAARYRRMRDRLAAVIAESTGESSSPDEAAAVVLALDAGLFLQHIIDPDAVTPELRARAITDVIKPGQPDGAENS